jgi:uncharacterized iron-regulated protein
MNMRQICKAAVASAAAFFVTVQANADQISMEALGALPLADVVILGEIHDNPEHHIAQAEVIYALSPPAVVFEMISDSQARQIRTEMLRDAAALERALAWNSSGWPDFEMYFPVFSAAQDALIFGAAAPAEALRSAREDSAAMAFGDSAQLFGLTRALDDREQSEREARQQSAHCNALPTEMLPGMVEAQRLRDAYLARAALAAFYETGGPVVVITGNGHARRDWGVPAR